MSARGAARVAVLVTTTVALAACDGSSSPHPSSSAPAPVAIETCAASVTVPSDTTQAVPSASVPPTAVIRTGEALSVNVPGGSTVGLGAPVAPGASAILCRASGATAGMVVLVGRHPGFVRLAVSTATGGQRVVNVQVTV